MKQTKLSTKLIFIGIFLIAAFFRFYNLNWDQGTHLHPDERFLTMVGTAMKQPQSFLQYLDPQTSQFNPANVGFGFYVYGTLPVVLNKIIALYTAMDHYGGFTLQGRFLSGLFDLLTLLVIIKMLSLIKKHHNFPEPIIYFAAALYAIAVLPIQLSHFFTTDTFLNFFMFISVYFMLKYYYTNKSLNIILSAIFIALAIASKVSAIYVVPIHISLMVLHSLKHNIHTPKSITQFVKNHTAKKIYIFSVACISFFLVTYVALRIADPHYFIDSNILHPKLNPTFIQSIQELERYVGKDTTYPPSIQWLNKLPVLFSLQNLAVFGTGLGYFFFIIIGIYYLIKKHRKSELTILLLWSIGYFLYQSTQFVKVMRYFVVIYPYLAIFAAFGIYYVAKKHHYSLKIIIFILLLIWPLSYVSIYTRPVTRVTASQWIYHNIPEGNILLNEHWDDPLPLSLPSMSRNYTGNLLPVFDPDTPEKWNTMNMYLDSGDYLILSSNRGWGSMPTVPDKYPRMTKFYEDLFAGKLAYKKVAEFTSYPSLKYLGIPITFPDDLADESFTVYDHPKVMIFKRD